AVDFKAGQGIDRAQVRLKWLRGVAELARFTGQIDLEQYRHGFSRLLGALADFLGGMQAVHAFNHLQKFDRIAALVGLQMPDEMPAQFAGAQRNFSLCFLDFILADEDEAKLCGLVDDLRWLPFRDGEERDGVRVASGTLAGGANALLN